MSSVYSLDPIKLVSNFIYRLLDKGCYGRMRSYFDKVVVIYGFWLSLNIIFYWILYFYWWIPMRIQNLQIDDEASCKPFSVSIGLCIDEINIANV